jgi:hypothetical protein
MSEARTADPPAQIAQQPARFASRNPIWPKALIAVGLGLTVGWTVLLGYGITKLIVMVI